VRLRRSALARGLCRLVEPRTRFHNPSLRESEKRQIRPIEMQPHLRLWITLRRCGWYGCCPIKAWCPTASFMSWSVQAVSAQNSGSCSLTKWSRSPANECSSFLPSHQRCSLPPRTRCS
jgi:hypothetical protein